MFKIGWKEGDSVIVARQTHEGSYRSGINVYAPTGLYHHVYDYIADVTPDGGGEAFRATFTEMFQSDDERRPLPGETARVKFDPKSREVRFDRKRLWEEAKAAKTKGESDFAALASGPPGSGPAAPNPSPAAASSGADSILIASFIHARAHGDEAETARLTALLEERGIPIPS